MSTDSWYGALIRLVLARNWDARRECPNHDAIVVERDGKLWIGESCPPVARLTSIEDYEKDIKRGYIYRIRVLEVVGATTEQEEAAADWWLDHVNNSPYDYMAFPRLLFKALFGNWINSAAGWTWARWCTEGIAESYKFGTDTQGVRDAWKEGKLYPWKKLNPTPLTTWMRWHQGKLRKVEMGDV
jgi:hypothetical protein